jgi:HAD superfamily phosphatase (TIGR01668 family)
MPFPLLPRWIYPSLTALTPQLLKNQGIRLLMLDFDNTIVPYTTNIPTQEMADWIKQLQATDICVCVVSNSKRDRVRIFCEEWGIDCITHAKKPFGRGIKRCIEKYGLAPELCALAGDQIFTDTLGANLAGAMPILVTPIHNHNIWLKLRHIAEKPFIFIAKRRMKQ